MIRICLLAALFASLSNVAWPQDPNTFTDEWRQKEEDKYFKDEQARAVLNRIDDTSQLIVMIRDQVGGGPSFGAGIIFGRDRERIYIATANHVVRRGAQQADAITVTLHFAPNKSFPARLLDHFDAPLDTAVIVIEDWTKTQIPGCNLPFYTSLQRPSSFDRTNTVYAIGNPNGEAWRPPSHDDLIGADQQELRFRSAFLGPGYSGGGLLTDQGELEGMIVRDEAPIGSAVPIDAVLSRVASWGYPVDLDNRFGNEPSLLESAARHGDIDKLTAALSNVCARPDDALFYAADSGQTEIVSSLLKAGIDPNASEHKQTALHAAVENHHASTVKLLLASGANVNAKNSKSETPLDLVSPEGASPAVAQAQLEIVQSLVDAGAKFGNDGSGWVPLGHALYAGNKEIASLLIRAGANVRQGDAFRTPLEIAVDVGNEDLVELLLAAGAKPDSRDLMTLVFSDRESTHPNIPRPKTEAILVTLLRAGVPIDNCSYCDPLLESINLGWRDAAHLLLQRGAKVDEPNGEGRFINSERFSPLELSIKRNDAEMVKLLLASGAKTNVPAPEDPQDFPLHKAACQSGPAILGPLLSAGAEINRRNVDRQTALDKAVACKNKEAEQFLRQHGGVK